MPPLQHQKDVFERSYDKKYYALFWEMGLGKSKTLIDTMTWLYLKQEIDGVLIISDKGNYMNWIHDQLPAHLIDGLNPRIGYYASSMKKKDKNQAERLLNSKDDTLDILCINIEALRSSNGYVFAEKFIHSHYTLIILDESTSIKSPKAKQTKAALRLGQKADYRRIATGTPITHSPIDLYSQAQFLKPFMLGFKSFVAFRSYYSDIRTIQMGSRSFPKVFGYRNLNELTTQIQPWSSRLTKDECLHLPPKIYKTVYVEQTPEQAAAYESLKSLAMAEFSGGMVTTTSALTTVMKLHQINCGHVKDDEGHTISIPHNRGDALRDLIQRIDDNTKFIIWCNFREDIRIVGGILAEMNIKYVEYYGSTSQEDRQESLVNFKTDPMVRGFVGTPGAGGKGLTLIGASYVIYYSNGHRLEYRLQSEDRAHRIGQSKTVTYVDLVIPRTVDDKIVNSLRSKKDLADEVLDNWRLIL